MKALFNLAVDLAQLGFVVAACYHGFTAPKKDYARAAFYLMLAHGMVRL